MNLRSRSIPTKLQLPPQITPTPNTPNKILSVEHLSSSTSIQWPLKTLLFLLMVPLVLGLGKLFYILEGQSQGGKGQKFVNGYELKFDILCSLGVSVLGYFLTVYMVPLVGPKLLPRLSGVDLCKKGLGGENDGMRIPESLGIVSGFVFMLCISVLEVIMAHRNGRGMEYNAALSSICFAVLLGLVDDVIDIKWKHKIQIGFFMSLPLLLSYSFNANTTIVVPRFLQGFVNNLQKDEAYSPVMEILKKYLQVDIVAFNLIDAGYFYYLYMFIVIVFCTNSINIYAGINGLEIGQSVVMAVSVAFVNILELISLTNMYNDASGRMSAVFSEKLGFEINNHLFSVTLMLPFIATSLGLLRFNFYPAQVFVGDIFPYYAGMVLAVSAILGHFAKSLLLLMIPQLLNFAYSLPQLFNLVPCPRHRLPKVNLKTGLLEPSKISPDSKRSNFTLLCLFLDIFGPMHERTLCVSLLLFQAFCAVIGILLRYFIGSFF